ncbi:MAG: She9 / Mdm33 family protein [Clostridiales Family XIII bacterium]|jgi:peptidoglycan hydrolase CwlO-like protein|nr:She9 / Mdm33 family protein [Clostridiales Family XIII bacterium]
MAYGDYEYYYNHAKSKYYNACQEINSCQNRINSLRSQRQKTIKRINQLGTDIKNNENALAQMERIVKKEESLKGKVLAISGKTGAAAVNFSGMVKSANVTGKNLSDVYGDETAKTKSTLNNVLSTLKTKKAALVAKLAELRSQKKSAEHELQHTESRIRSAESDLAEWKRVKTGASYDMEYYRRKMQEAV